MEETCGETDYGLLREKVGGCLNIEHTLLTNVHWSEKVSVHLLERQKIAL